MAHEDTIRILVLRGGGTKARVPQYFLTKFCTQFDIDGSRLWEMFDVIGGTSSGSMQGCAYASGIAPESLDSFLLEESKWVFTNRNFPSGCDATNPSNRPNFIEKVVLAVANEPFYKSPCRPDGGNSNFGDNILKSGLTSLFGNFKLSDLKTTILIPAFQLNTNKFVYFSNYVGNPYIGANEKIVDVTMASGAAPLYLPSYTFSGNTYQDGGLFENNPLQSALTLAHRKKPLATRAVVLSLSTGSPYYGFEGASPADPPSYTLSEVSSLFDICSDGQSAAGNLDLRIRSDSTLEQLHYYEFENPFSTDAHFELDMSEDSYFAALDSLTDTTYTAQQPAILDIYNRLVA